MAETINESDFLLYHGEDGKTHAQVILGDETVWVSQNSMAEIFQSSKQNISYHIGNIFRENELIENSVVKEILTTANDGKKYNVLFYNLDVIIGVGYRISSYQATKFRQWATRVLKEYLIKGFVLDDERLKQGNRLFGKDYFRELLERIREIRTSERMFYEKITDLYAISIDYDKNDPRSQAFFAKVQNKLEYAIVGQTSPEIIRGRADARLPYMGLKTFKNSNRDGKVQKTDITIAKNYLTKEELTSLNLLVSAFLDHAEIIVSKGTIMKMSDWASRLDKFLDFNEYKILNDSGKIQRKVADSFAEKQWDKFKIIQDRAYKSDFNNVIVDIKSKGGIPKESEAIHKAQEEKEPLSSFNQKLVVALEFNPKSKPERQKRVVKSKTKECPICGKEHDKTAKFCDGDVDGDGDIIKCSHLF